MKRLNELLQELGISKVRLAKYLGVSRQMVYNYLELDDLNKWPKEKKLLLFKLLDITDGSEDTISEIKVTTDYLMTVENRLNQGVKNTSDLDSFFDLKGLSKENQTLLADITYLLKEKLLEENKQEENRFAVLYLYPLTMYQKSNIYLDTCQKQLDLLIQKNTNLMKINNSFLKEFYIPL